MGEAYGWGIVLSSMKNMGFQNISKCCCVVFYLKPFVFL